MTIAWTPHPHRGGWLTASVEPQRADLYPRGNFPMDVTQDHTRLEEWVSNRDRQQANDRAHQFVRRWVQRPTERVNALRLSVRQVQAALG